MSDIGLIPVDWEVRFDPQRMLRERLQRAKDALKNSDLDAQVSLKISLKIFLCS